MLRFPWLLLAVYPLIAQPPGPPAATPAPATPAPTAAAASQPLDVDRVLKQVDDLMWHIDLGDIAEVDKVEYTSLPPAHMANPRVMGANNPLIIRAYTFIPKNLDRSKPQPLIVFAHQGIHANSDTRDAHIFRELLQQGYSIISSDYRGSTGYGRAFYEQIDYGGREVDDVFLGMQWMLDTYPFLDPKRVGIIGWSHGGLITLMNIFQHPQSYAVAYAGVPASDLVARMGYQSEQYRSLYSAPYHLGKTVREDIGEYRKRSPVTHAKELQTPLLIHTNTNDEDVSVLEVEHLIEALKVEGKKFEYKIYQDAPGGHYFNRTDTKLAKESRREVYRFLAGYLHPANPL
ncbi:MAG TPA: prolyl oligopeptidase family serine peptidase [Bryobacteraceae bacterium]|jgi:dipeptidyl aminopeptidase/acylaminoacyl peptidase|nr:prolyl oligopeptidase family serine peptidase [Bryobacteraceae bacterium]